MGSFQQCACQFNPIISKFSQIISWNWFKWIDRWFWGLWIITSEAIYFMCVCVLKPGMWPKGRTQNGNHKRKNMTLCKYRWGQWKHDRPNVIPCDQKKNFFFLSSKSVELLLHEKTESDPFVVYEHDDWVFTHGCEICHPQTLLWLRHITQLTWRKVKKERLTLI